MRHHHSAVAIYSTHTDAEVAVKELQSSQVDKELISIVGRDHGNGDHVVGYYKNGTSLKYWGSLGACWGGMWSFLDGEAFFWMPGVGAILVGGPLVSAIVGGLDGATMDHGLSALGSALRSMSIPKSRVFNYESALKANKVLVVVHGTGDGASQAVDILRKTQPIEFASHDD